MRPDLSAADASWITEGRRPFGDYMVGSLVPVVFEAYARILHPAWAPSGRKDTPLRWEAVAAWSGRTVHALAQWESIARPMTGTAPAAPELPFAAQPDTDGLPAEALAVLCEVLAAHTGTPDACCIGAWEGHGWPVDTWAGAGGLEALHLENRTYLIRQGPLAQSLDIGWRSFFGEVITEPPNLLWPADRAWFVSSDTDLDSTYLGGSAALVDALLRHPGLEAWPIQATDHITIDSDTVNR